MFCPILYIVVSESSIGNRKKPILLIHLTFIQQFLMITLSFQDMF